MKKPLPYQDDQPTITTVNFQKNLAARVDSTTAATGCDPTYGRGAG